MINLCDAIRDMVKKIIKIICCERGEPRVAGHVPARVYFINNENKAIHKRPGNRLDCKTFLKSLIKTRKAPKAWIVAGVRGACEGRVSLTLCLDTRLKSFSSQFQLWLDVHEFFSLLSLFRSFLIIIQSPSQNKVVNS